MSKESLSYGQQVAPAAAANLRVPLSQPLRHARYRSLWLANLVSNLGSWTQTFAAAWLITSMASSASTATLVQTATYVPIFLFALLAGVLADGVHRPKFLFYCNLFMAVCAAAMAALVVTDSATALPVLLLTFCLGVGSAFAWPAWQASLCGLVEPHEVEAAATLNTLSYNTAAILGPALGGLLFKWIGPGALFMANAVSFAGLMAVYWAWWHEPRRDEPCRLDYWSSLKDGLRTAFGCARYRHILANVFTVFFATIVFAALLPVFVRDVLHRESHVYGILMGSLGAGAVAAAFFMPHVRARVERTRLLALSLLVFGCMLVTMPALRKVHNLVPLIVCGGMAWSTLVSTLNAAAQSSFPAGVRARTLSVYLFVMAAGYTVGSLFWGRFADRFGVSAALYGAGACVILNAFALLHRRPARAI